MTQIHIRPADGLWTAHAAGALVAESRAALELIEGDRPAVIYFPRQDVAVALLSVRADGSACPHKGDASHFDIVTPAARLEDACWSYESPRQTVGAIAGHVAFVPGKVTLRRA